MAEKQRVRSLSKDTFRGEVVKASKPVLVDFWADWCAPCRAVAPVVKQLAGQFEGRAVVGKVNVDDEPELAREFGIRSIPSLLIFHNGKVVDRVVGAVPATELAQKLEAVVTAA
jgi:thioredoxin 1